MTLIEKLLPKMYCYFGSGMLTDTYDENVALQNAKKCEQIADEFAIEFGDWIGKNTITYHNGKFRMKTLTPIFLTSEQLLEQFKKEKGL